MKYTISQDRIAIIPNEQMRRKSISQFLDDYCISVSKKKDLISKKMILLDDEPVPSPEEVIGSRIVTILFELSTPDWKPAEHACTAVYEDAFVYAVHKEAGIIIHGEEDDVTCLNALAARYQLDRGIRAPVRPLHRLDRDTAGLVLYSKIPFFQPWFDTQMKEKKITRYYLAVCHGKCEKGKKFTVRKKLARDRHRSGAYRVSQNGKDAVTHFECLDSKGGYVLFGCTLETGRTHQIRVHLADEGYPIVNDILYGRPSKQFAGMGLWAQSIVFRNPVSNKKHRIRDYENPLYTYFESGGYKR